MKKRWFRFKRGGACILTSVVHLRKQWVFKAIDYVLQRVVEERQVSRLTRLLITVRPSHDICGKGLAVYVAYYVR